MAITDGFGSLRPTVRRQLIDNLEKLSSKDIARRSAAALAVSRIMRERELSWDLVVVSASREGAGAEEVTGGWPAPCLRLLDHPGVTAEERATLRRLAAWRAPGRHGLAVLAKIAGRVDDPSASAIGRNGDHQTDRSAAGVSQ